MKANFDSSVEMPENDILEGEENGQTQTGQSNESSAPEGSREATSSSPSKSHSHQIAFSSELPFSKTRKVW